MNRKKSSSAAARRHDANCACCDPALLEQPLLHLLISPEFQSLSLLVAGGVRNEARALVSLTAYVPLNSASRTNLAHLCRLSFFAADTDSDDELASAARLMLTMQHTGETHALLRELLRIGGGTPSTRFCQMNSSSQRWSVYDNLTNAPVLPPCGGGGGDPTLHCAECAGVECEPVTAQRPPPASTASDQLPAPTAQRFRGVITRSARCDAEQPNHAAYARARGSAHRNNEQSHFGYMCRLSLEAAEEQLEERLGELDDDAERRCELCRQGGAGRERLVSMMRPRAMLSTPAARRLACTQCLGATLQRVRNVLSWASANGVECAGARGCACVYDAAVASTGLFVNVTALPEPHDPCYEAQHESLYDRRSPLVRDFMSRYGDKGRAIVNAARVPRGNARTTPDALRGYTFGERLDYDGVLAAARRVYAQPDAKTLSAIAVGNVTHAPLLGERRWSIADTPWLPEATYQRLEALNTALAVQNARDTVAQQSTIFSESLERLLFAELATTDNRRLAIARIQSFVIPHPRTMCGLLGAGVYMLVALAMAEVCETAANVVAEETAAHALALIRLESAQRAAADAAQSARKRAGVEQKQRRRQRATHVAQAGTRRKSVEQKPVVSEYASLRVLAKQREPITKLDARELAELQAENAVKAHAVATEAARQISATLEAPLKRQRCENRLLHQSTGRLMCEHLLGVDLYTKIFVKE